MKLMITPITCAVLFAAIAGCTSSNAETTEVSVYTDTIDGVETVRNTGSPRTLTATPVLRVGSVGEGPDAFGRIRSVIADHSGNIFVADNLASEIRVFDSSGRSIRTIGRQGAGPAEFGDLYSLAWLDEHLAAMDPRNARISVLTREGAPIDAIRYYPISGPATLIRLHPLGQDGFYAPVIDRQKPRMPFVRMTSSGPADTILAPQPPPNAARSWIMCDRPDGGVTGMSAPESPNVIYAFPPIGEQVVAAWSAQYRLAFLDSRGDTARVIIREQPPVAYPDSAWNETQAVFRKLHDDFPGTKCEPATLTRPAARAPIRSMAFDEAGRLWVEAAGDVGFVWDVFDAAGHLIGSVPAPPRSTAVPPYIRDNRIYQVETDDLGVEYVAVYHVALTR